MLRLYHGELNVPLIFIKTLRRCSAKLRKRFERLESYCFENGCYSVADEDKKQLNITQLKRFVHCAQKRLGKKGVTELVTIVRLIGMCAASCLSVASIINTKTNEAVQARMEQMEYRSKMLKYLSMTGEMVLEIQLALPTLIEILPEHTYLLNHLHATIESLTELFSC